MSLASILRIVATLVSVTVTALVPFYGKAHWFAVVVGVSSALALAAPSLFPPQPPAPKP